MDYSQNENKRPSGKKKKKASLFVKILRVVLVLILISVFAVGGLFVGAYIGIAKQVEDINTDDIIPGSYNSIIYDPAGNEIDTLHGKENREYVKLEAIPLDLQNAVISIEDERFYKHNGIDIKSIMRALVTNIKEKSFSQGASTLTQQLIKNTILTSDKTIVRKIQEQYIAMVYEKKLEEQLGSKTAAKKYILELYLNSIALNHGLYGVEAASEFYFGKTVSELTLSECASIASITQNPSKYSPVSHPDFNNERRLIVLKKMLDQGYISQSQYVEAKNDDIYSRIVGKKSDGYTESLHNYFVDALIVEIAKDLVSEKKMTEKQAYDLIYSGGLKIESTIDTNIQAIMEESYKNDALFPPKGNTLDVEYTISIRDIATDKQTHHTKKTTVNTKEEADAFAQQVKNELLNNTNELVLDKLIVTESLQSAMVVMDYRNGHVKAVVGGRGEKPGDLVFNRATDALRSPGSSFKPLAVYGPAIDLGLISNGSVVVDEEYTINDYSPRNWNGKFLGPVTIRQAIKDSMNVVAVKTLVEKVGFDNAYKYLTNLGFTSLSPSDKVPSLALGGITNGVSVLEMTAAYSTIANNGVYNEPIFYTRILDHNGNVLIEKTPTNRQVFKPSTAYMLTDMMQDVVTGGGNATGRLANFKDIKMHIAGKTGTTNDDKDLTFVGYTPYYCAGIWLGYDIQKPIRYDKSYHLLLWRDVMEKAHKGLPDKEFGKPNTVGKRTVCTVSGKVPIPGVCEKDYFDPGKVESDLVALDNEKIKDGTCDIHKIYRIDTSTGLIANEFCPSDKIKSVAFAVDSKGNVINAPVNNPFNVNKICTVHTKPEAPPPIEEEEKPDIFVPEEEQHNTVTDNDENSDNSDNTSDDIQNNISPSVPSTPPSVPSNPPSVPSNPPSVPNTPPSVPSTPPGVPSTPPGVPNNPPSVPSTPPSVPSTPPSVPSTTPNTHEDTPQNIPSPSVDTNDDMDDNLFIPS